MCGSSNTCHRVFIACLLLVAVNSASPTSAQSEEPSHPNLLVDASGRFVVAGLTQSLDYAQPLNDYILGARVTGWGYTTGRMDARLVADPNHATMQWVARGRTDMDTIARQRRVTVQGKGVTTFTANKKLTFDQTGFTGGPASSSAQSDNWPRCISAPPLVRGMAWRRVQRQRSEGNQIVASHAEPLINERLNKDAGAIIDAANEAYRREFREPLLRAGAFPQQMDFSTSGEELKVVILQAAEGQAGAPQAAPPFDLAHDIGIRMHETAFNNLAESLLAGLTLTDEEVRSNVAKFLTMASLEEYSPSVDADEKPWSITFSQRSPITVKFDDGIYTLVIAGEQWESGRRRFRSQMNVSVSYRIEMAGEKVHLIREEDVLIAPPGFVRGKGRLSPRTLGLRRMLQRKFDELFPEVIDPEAIVVPGPWENAGPLNVVRMEAEAGWLQMSWRMRSPQASEVAGESVQVGS